MQTLKSLLLALALVAGAGLMLAACQPAEPTAEPPTALPEPIEEPTVVITETEAATSPLDGTSWSLVSHGDPVSPTLTLTDTRITASFAEGQVTGTGGCNNYFAPFSTDGDSITIGMGGGTAMACEEPIMAQEQAYLGLLAGAATFSTTETELVVTTSDGMVLNFAAEAPVGLEGTSWTVMSYNNGMEAVVSVTQGTTITATFDGTQVTGNAGCNNYFADYTTDGDAITIGPAGSTRMFCEPAELMAQEAAYLAALATAATWSIGGADTLELRTAEGAIAVQYMAVMATDAMTDTADGMTDTTGATDAMTDTMGATDAMTDTAGTTAP